MNRTRPLSGSVSVCARSQRAARLSLSFRPFPPPERRRLSNGVKVGAQFLCNVDLVTTQRGAMGDSAKYLADLVSACPDVCAGAGLHGVLQEGANLGPDLVGAGGP